MLSIFFGYRDMSLVSRRTNKEKPAHVVDVVDGDDDNDAW